MCLCTWWACRYSGHNDVVKSIEYLPQADCYLTASWDRSLRLWARPNDPRKSSGDGEAKAGGGEGPAPNMLLLEYDEDEETFISEYEKAHPLEVPRALTEVRSAASHTIVPPWTDHEQRSTSNTKIAASQ